MKDTPVAERRPLTSRQERALATRQHIAEVALRLFAKQGFAATSTKQLAQEAGVAEGLIFHYFKSKAALLQVVAKQRRTFAGEVMNLLKGAEARPARELLPEVAGAWVSLMLEEREIVGMLLSESQTNAELSAALRSVIFNTAEQLALYLEARAEAGELRADLHFRTSALAFFSPLLVFFITHRDLSEAVWHKEATAFVEELLDTWFQGATVGNEL